jgi:phosphoribosylanthranilate isomerase
VAPDVDAILLDSGNPALKVKELGGTGRRHDWALSREIRERVDVPVWLAGGLNPENAREAIETVGPFGLDLCSGLRTGEGYDLDLDKLERFMAAVT